MPSKRKRGNAYELRASCGFNAKGKRIMKTRTWKPPYGMTEAQAEKEATRQAFLFEEEIRRGEVLDQSTLMEDFLVKWLHNYAEKQLRATTLTGYKSMLPRINAAFGKMKISDIRPTHLLAFYDNLSDAGVRGDEYFTATELVGELAAERFATRKAFFTAAGISKRTSQSMFAGGKVTGDTAGRVCAVLGADFDALFTADEGGTLSANTIRHYHRLLSVIFSTAVSWQVIYSNPCERVKPPKMRRKESRYLDEDGVAEVVAALADEPYDYSVMVRMLIYSGLRRGELLGLEWSDLNTQTGCISVERSLLYSPERGVFVDDTKTDGSHRILRLPKSALDLLEEYRAWQEGRRAELGSLWQDSDRIFTAWDGGMLNPEALSKWFHKFIVRKGLPDVSIHGLRHTNATLLIAGGVPLKTVSSRLGHSSISTTGNIYAHAIRSAEEAAADVLEGILGKKDEDFSNNGT